MMQQFLCGIIKKYGTFIYTKIIMENCTRIWQLIFLFLFFNDAAAQKSKADSLRNLLAFETKDSLRVKRMWQLASEVKNYDPEEALRIAQRALYLAREIKDTEGQSRSLGVIANTFLNLGNYSRALEYNLEKLKIEEGRSLPRNLASVLMSIAIVYSMNEEYEKSLPYFQKSDSVITTEKVSEFYYHIKLNRGDVYDKMNLLDSAFIYYNASLGIARTMKSIDFEGASMTGIGHVYRKKNQFDSSAAYYHAAIPKLTEANDEILVCEAALGLAKLYRQFGKNDSAVVYARLSDQVALKASFINDQLKSSELLSTLFKETKNIDSAFYYVNTVRALNDSVNSKNRIREIQALSINEQQRQLQIEEEKRLAKKERSQQLQLLFIAVFIPGFFLITLMLSRVKIPVRVVRFLGVLSLIILFEYLTLLLHPLVKEMTHHTPVYEMIIFVCIAILLIPAHHRIEHWLIGKLVRNREGVSPTTKKIRIQTKRIKLK